MDIRTHPRQKESKFNTIECFELSHRISSWEACKRENIIQRREIGTTIRQIWLVVVTTFSKKTRRPSTMPNELVATARRYCAGKDDTSFFAKGC